MKGTRAIRDKTQTYQQMFFSYDSSLADSRLAQDPLAIGSVQSVCNPFAYF